MPQRQPSMTGCTAIEAKGIAIYFYPKDMAEKEEKIKRVKDSLSQIESAFMNVSR